MVSATSSRLSAEAPSDVLVHPYVEGIYTLLRGEKSRLRPLALLCSAVCPITVIEVAARVSIVETRPISVNC